MASKKKKKSAWPLKNSWINSPHSHYFATSSSSFLLLYFLYSLLPLFCQQRSPKTPTPSGLTTASTDSARRWPTCSSSISRLTIPSLTSRLFAIRWVDQSLNHIDNESSRHWVNELLGPWVNESSSYWFDKWLIFHWTKRDIETMRHQVNEPVSHRISMLLSQWVTQSIESPRHWVSFPSSLSFSEIPSVRLNNA